MLDKQKLVDGIFNLYANFPTSINEAVLAWLDIYTTYAKDATLGSGMNLIQSTWDEGIFIEKLTKALDGTDLENSTQHFDNAFGMFWLTTAFQSSGGNIPTITVAVYGSMKEALDIKKASSTIYMTEQQTADFFGGLIDNYTKLAFNTVLVPGTPPVPVPFTIK